MHRCAGGKSYERPQCFVEASLYGLGLHRAGRFAPTRQMIFSTAPIAGSFYHLQARFLRVPRFIKRRSYVIGVAVSSSCIWRFDVGSSDEKIKVGFFSGTIVNELHLF